MVTISYISMAPGVSLSYVAWWVGVHLDDIGMGEDDNSNEADNNERSKEDDAYQVNNMIHDVPPYEGEGVDGLTILATTTPTLGKILTQFCNFINFHV